MAECWVVAVIKGHTIADHNGPITLVYGSDGDRALREARQIAVRPDHQVFLWDMAALGSRGLGPGDGPNVKAK